MLSTTVRLGRSSTTGWIGLGAMGHPMAINLFTKTFLAERDSSKNPSFLICEQDDARAEAFIRDLREKGGSEVASRVERVGSGREMGKSASRIVTMLPSTPQVEAVYLDPTNGILAGLRELPGDTPQLHSTHTTNPSAPSLTTESLSSTTTLSQSAASPGTTPSAPHTLLIDQTTLDPTTAARVAQTVQSETSGQALMLDAPVSGGIVAAAAGLLTIMFGSPSSHATQLARPLLERMAREGGVIECGGNGTGVGVKVCNNLILAINQIALAEGMALGRSLNIDPLLLHNVVNTSSGASWSSRVNSPLPEVPNSPGSRNYSGGFQSRLMLKDVGLALHAAHAHDLPTPLTWAAKSVYDAVCEEGDGAWAGKDFSVVFEWLKKKQADGVERGWKDGGPSA